uniref:EF-Tu/IF-2/RF-3 family GTPase n=1 Tax=Desertifilum tharense IPPAS B-1220 TaxID=1781255 RepID=A0ACD5GWY7_9CYAN
MIVYFRVMDGNVKKGDRVRLMATGKEYEIDELGVLSPTQVPLDELHAGEVGYLAASIKAVADARVGDTITLAAQPASEPLPGYTEAKPMVFCGTVPHRRRSIWRLARSTRTPQTQRCGAFLRARNL